MENSVDCSAFVQDVYKTVGIQLPRNGDEQETAFPGVNMIGLNREERIRVIKALEPGSLMFTPSHVMLYLGEKNAHPYMIHESHNRIVNKNNNYANAQTHRSPCPLSLHT